MAQQHGTAWICSDCKIWNANTDASGAGKDWSEEKFDSGVELLARFAQVPAHWLTLAPQEEDEVGEDGEPLDENGRIDFTWMPCDVCGDSLAGERIRVAILSN